MCTDCIPTVDYEEDGYVCALAVYKPLTMSIHSQIVMR